MFNLKNINQITIFACFLCLCMTSKTTHGNTANLPIEECKEAYIPDEIKHLYENPMAGHDNAITPGPFEGTCIKPNNHSREESCYEALMNDVLRDFVPKYHGKCMKNGEEHLILQFLLTPYPQPSRMDCKIAGRTFSEDDNKSMEILSDMFELDLENANGDEKLLDLMKKINGIKDFKELPLDKRPGKDNKPGVRKVNSMKWRDIVSTTYDHGIRIYAHIRFGDEKKTKFPLLGDYNDAKERFRIFVSGDRHVMQKYLDRLEALENALIISIFYKTYSLVGISLFFVHNQNKNVQVDPSIWMIDFAKTVKLLSVADVKHDDKWNAKKMKNGKPVFDHQDGSLMGVRTLIKIFKELLAENPPKK